MGRSAAAWLRMYRALAWVTQPKYTAGSLVLVRRAGPDGPAILLVRARLRTPSLWGLPGGFRRRHESAAQAAARELAEETGLELPVRDTDAVASYEQPWARHLDTLFVVTAPSDLRARRASPEIAEVGWFLESQLPPLTRETVLALRHLPGAPTDLRPEPSRP